jgi:hypothetical protein
VLATASTDALPWATPIFYNYALNYSRIVWESSRFARHSELIAGNENISIAIANFNRREADEAVYLTAKAREVPPEGLADALEVFLHGGHDRENVRQRTVELYHEDQPLRLYEAIIENAWLLRVTHDPDGRRIDERVAIAWP